MELIADTGTAFIAWPTKAGHRDENDQWICDDPPGRRTGPPGKAHAAEISAASTYCGKTIPADTELTVTPGAPLNGICLLCLRKTLKPYL